MKKYILIILLILTLNFLSLASVSALSIVVHVPEKYTDVQAGERFYFEIGVEYPENPSRKDLRLNYEILTQEGEVIAQSKILKAIETQASFIDYILIPESAETCRCNIIIKISDYGDLSEEVSTSFNIVSKKTEQIKTYFFILLAATILVGILVVINIIIRRKR